MAKKRRKKQDIFIAIITGNSPKLRIKNQSQEERRRINTTKSTPSKIIFKAQDERQRKILEGTREVEILCQET